MNKIILENDKLIDTLNNNEINIEYLQNELIGINYLKIELLQDTNLQINYNLEKQMKLEVEIIVNDNVKAQIFEKITGTNTKIRTKYKLNENTKLTTTKFNDIETIKEYAIICKIFIVCFLNRKKQSCSVFEVRFQTDFKLY